jgi:hypothetical protein
VDKVSCRRLTSRATIYSTNNASLRAGFFISGENMDNFTVASQAANVTAHGLVAKELDPIVIADAMLTEAMAVFVAATGRHAAARDFLKVWIEVRDGN